MTPNNDQIKALKEEQKQKTLIWTDYKLINRSTFYSKARLQNICYFMVKMRFYPVTKVDFQTISEKPKIEFK